MLGIPARRSIDEAFAKYNNYSIPTRRWQPPPLPTLRILQLPNPPTRNRRLKKRNTDNNTCGSGFRAGGEEEEALCKARGRGRGRGRGKLEALFGQERQFARSVPIILVHPNAAAPSPRRGKVILRKSRESGVRREHCSDDVSFELEGAADEEKHDVVRRRMSSSFSSETDLNERWGPEDWKFQAEVLRAECNLLRMEKEVAVKKWEQGCAELEHAVRMVHSLHSAVQTIVTGRKKIVDEKNAQIVLQTTLENQIEGLERKLQKLQKNSEFRDNELNRCSNFDRQAKFLQRRLDKLRNSSKERSYSEDTAKSLQQRLEKLVMAACSSAQSESDKEEDPELGCVEAALEDAHLLTEPSLRIQTSSSIKSCLGNQRNTVPDAALLKKRLDYLSMGLNESKEAAAQISKEYRYMLNSSGNCSSRKIDAPGKSEQGVSQDNKLCSERCKATIRKIAEQVEAETDQWSQLQEILHHVREEMEDLQKSRDFWEDHALDSDAKIATLQAAMHEWREKAHTYDNKVSELQSESARLRSEIEQARQRHALEQTRWLDAQSRLTQALILSNSRKSSMGSVSDCESDNQEVSVHSYKMRNPSASREMVVHPIEDQNWDEKENSKTKYPQNVKRRASKIMQNSHTCSNKHFVNNASKHSQHGSNQKSFTMHPQQSDCVGEPQLSEKRSNRNVQALHSKENVLLQKKHPQRENLGKWDQLNRHVEAMGSEKPFSGSMCSPLSDIVNASPFRNHRANFPVSSDDSSGLGSPEKQEAL